MKQESQKVTGGQFRGPVKGPGSGSAEGRAKDTGAAGEGKEPGCSQTVHQAEHQEYNVSQTDTASACLELRV